MRSLVTMQRMIQSRLAAQQTDAVVEEREASAEREARASAAATIRAAAKRAQVERKEDAVLQHTEQVQQERLEKRQLRLAAELQAQAHEFEHVELAAKRRQDAARKRATADSRALASSFSVAHNGMARQMRLGELRRRSQTNAVDASMRVAMARQQAQTSAQASASRRVARAEALRAGATHGRVLASRLLAEREARHKHEVDLVQVKKRQLAEIRLMLDTPADV